MKIIKILLLVALFAAAVFTSKAFINAGPLKIGKNMVVTDNKGFAVVELYTSESCSSCPPADELVAKLKKESKDMPVYILAYHVDYWNRLGWKDQFSNADYSKRQNEYANYLHTSSVYTPQIVFNGKTEFVGSEEGTLRNAIKASLQKPAAAQLALNVLPSAQHEQAILTYNIEGGDKNTVLLIATLQKAAVTKITGGENGGRTLAHVQLVRKLQRVPLKGESGQADIVLPKDFDAQRWEIIGLLQNPVNGAISGAARAIINNAASVQAKM